MPRLLLALVAALMTLTASVAAVGCGSDDLPSVTAADAAAATREAETARIAMNVRMSGMGLPAPMSIKARGVSAMAAPRMDMTMDFGPILKSFGADADGRTRMVLDGGRLLVDPPSLPGVELPGGATWVTADLGEVLETLGVDVRGLSELMRLGPEQQIAAVKAAGSVKTVGEEEIDGVRTTHLRGSVKLSDYLKGLPADRRRRAQDAIRQLDKLPGGDTQSFDEPTPTDLWVDEDKRLRRMTQSSTLPAQQGLPGGKMTITLDLSDFGTKLDLPKPAGGDVYDATDDLTKLLRQAR